MLSWIGVRMHFHGDFFDYYYSLVYSLMLWIKAIRCLKPARFSIPNINGVVRNNGIINNCALGVITCKGFHWEQVLIIMIVIISSQLTLRQLISSLPLFKQVSRAVQSEMILIKSFQGMKLSRCFYAQIFLYPVGNLLF